MGSEHGVSPAQVAKAERARHPGATRSTSTTGAPNRAVTAFSGKIARLPGTPAADHIRQQRGQAAHQHRRRNQNPVIRGVATGTRHKCGTATPRNAIGPQNAVTAPSQHRSSRDQPEPHTAGH
jgi:hypothetical protein